MNPSSKLFERVQDVLRRRHYSYQTEKSYIQWIKRFVAFQLSHVSP
ncbi:MAG: hypothetical protein HC840_11580 [Leptolyngbyaceae cyanobacterium RM2_2_4]|nr:hypothetical protein [Leptolyngbyaceae cyanobacterium SM1_4_3]NJO49964.1 hypothetical protein [Leptolyngbyaceae cyanobacterium RM2_2_4]